MARKPIAKVGDKVVVEGIDNVLEVLEVALAKDAFPQLMAGKRAVYRNLYAYKLKMITVKPKWFLEDEVEYVVRYNPRVLEMRTHVELVQNLVGYETLRDYLETLPNKGKHNHAIVELMKLVEYAGLLAEGDSQERVNAEAEIISIVQ